VKARKRMCAVGVVMNSSQTETIGSQQLSRLSATLSRLQMSGTPVLSCWRSGPHVVTLADLPASNDKSR